MPSNEFLLFAAEADDLKDDDHEEKDDEHKKTIEEFHHQFWG